MKKTRVLHVVLSLEIGGMEQVVADLIKSTNQDEFVSVVACLNDLGPIAEELISVGVQVLKVDSMTPIVSYLYPGKLIRIIREQKIDVVHVHSGCWHKTAIAARYCGVKKIIYTDHGRKFPDSSKVMILDRLVSPITRHVVAVSDNLGKYLRVNVGIPEKKVKVIINGIDVDRFLIARNLVTSNVCLRFGIIARLAPVKDIATLIRAMAIVRQHNPHVLLSIVGDGPERDSLESLVNELGLAQVISFLGFRRDIPSVLKEIDIFVLVSLSEGTSITLLEAMASGKPVVVTDVGGNPAIVEQGVNGLLVPPGDSEVLAQALLNISVDSELRQSMATANINKVTEHYSIQSMARHYEVLYRDTTC